MADPYWRYAAPADTTGSVPNLTFPGYLQHESSPLASQHLRNTNDLQGASTDYQQKDVLPLNTGGIDHDLGHRREVALGLTPAIPDIVNERPVSSVKVDGFPDATGESSILFVDGLPNDCTRREVGHLFRPFIGFKDIKVVHKEPRHSEDKAMVLCFVEFDDAKCALTALEALQGYKFDYKKPNSPCLRIHFARFPFRLPSGPR